ncbi:hypothetical protein [Nonomuraea endophytica]|uniref:Uncharacterized protein n=1 Tax=Nonomuraea endophytica TaxID=714136 RepID=A0A7W8A246_9ACTN|nr:hypothetical protein [Nonomuraea endophytica]MBB5077569.1 hypothetical protein [Nonomuraea endophytica]
MRRTLLAATALLLSGCSAATSGTIPSTVREPPGRRVCAGANQPDFDAGLDDRVVVSGPAALLAFALAPPPSTPPPSTPPPSAPPPSTPPPSTPPPSTPPPSTPPPSTPPPSAPPPIAPPSGGGPAVRGFKLAVRAEPGADFTVTTRTPGTALLFDRAKYRRDNAYTLSDGTPSYRFTGCADRRALWVGNVLTTGPIKVELSIRYGAADHPVTVTAYARK